MILKKTLKPSILLLFYSLLLMACSEPKTDYKLILGTWETIDIANGTGKNFTEQTTFYEGDSAFISIKLNGNETERYKLTYKVNTKDAKLQLERDANLQNQYRIELINEKELNLLDLHSGSKKMYLKKK